MQNDVERIFAAMSDVRPPDGLVEGIIRRIETEKMKRRAGWHIVIFSAVSSLSAIGAYITWQSAGAELANSGFAQYVSLITTDASALFSYWDSFFYAAAESFPVASAAAFLAFIVMFITSFKHLFRDARAVFARQLTA